LRSNDDSRGSTESWDNRKADVKSINGKGKTFAHELRLRAEKEKDPKKVKRQERSVGGGADSVGVVRGRR